MVSAARRRASRPTGSISASTSPSRRTAGFAACSIAPVLFDEATIQEAGRRLSEAAPLGAQVVLFGSHARGDAGPHSDLDFLIVEPSVDDPSGESVRLRRTLRGLGLFADVIVVSEHEAERWGVVRGSLIHTALSEGRPLAA
jgi:uncharacterized protein